MKTTNIIPFQLSVVFFLFAFNCGITDSSNKNDNGSHNNPYLGQNQPGNIPEVFAPGIVSTELHEFSCCFSPDGNEFYFARRDSVLNKAVIMVSKRVNETWTELAMASFVENKYSFEPWVTPDNKRLYFQFGEPILGQSGPPMNVLYVEREQGGWGEVINPGEPFNPAKAMHISSTEDGTIYTTDISRGPGTECLAIIKNINGQYLNLEKLGDPLNREAQSMHPYVATDGSYLIFGVKRPSQQINSVLFFSHKEDSSWSEPKEINLGINAGLPFVTSDGKYLFFTSGEQGKGDIYWVDAKIIEQLKIDAMK